MAKQQSKPSAATPTGTSSRFDRRKEEILKTAGSLINLHGLRDTTLALVAAEVGLNLKSLRYYFPKKEILVADAFLESIALHCQLVERALAEADFETRIRTFVADYFALKSRVYRGEQAEFVHFGDTRALTPPHLDTVSAAYVDFFRLTRRLFQAEGRSWSRPQQSALAHLLISQLLWSVIWSQNYIVEDFGRAADRLSDILLHGLAAKPEALPPLSSRSLNTQIARPFDAGDRLSQESFLRAATHSINRFGYRGASVDRISQSLNVTKGAFYHYNDTRDGLVMDCFERTFDIVRQAQDRAVSEEADGLSRVCAAAISLVTRQMLPEGELLRTAALTAIDAQHRHEVAQRMSLLTLRFADMLNDGLLDGSVWLCDMRIAAETVTAMINAGEELRYWVPEADVDTAAELFVRPLVLGFLRT